MMLALPMNEDDLQLLRQTRDAAQASRAVLEKDALQALDRQGTAGERTVALQLPVLWEGHTDVWQIRVREREAQTQRNKPASSEITLRLEPSALGPLQASLFYAEKRLTVRLLVSEPWVADLLNGLIDSLKEALRLRGYESTAIAVEVGDVPDHLSVPADDDTPDGPETIDLTV